MNSTFKQQQLSTKLNINSAKVVRPAKSFTVKAIKNDDPSRPYGKWLPGVLPPAHLKAEAPGDFAFDPLNLGVNPDRFKWYAEAEKYNGRWAMAGCAGVLGQELLGVQPKWFEAGAKDYGVPFAPLLAVEFIVFGYLEYKRLIGFQETGKSGVLNSFPFDPANLDSPTNQVKEIKNGRLAMIAYVGFSVQALLTREQPIEGLLKHVSNPLGHNLASNLTHLPAFAQ